MRIHPLNRRTLMLVAIAVLVLISTALLSLSIKTYEVQEEIPTRQPAVELISQHVALSVPQIAQPWWAGCELIGQGNRAAGRCMMHKLGWGDDQWACLEALWTRESGWEHNARNRTSGAGGIPQSHPASKMAAAGPNWRTDAVTQMDWGLHYIKGKYGTPCRANAVQLRTKSY